MTFEQLFSSASTLAMLGWVVLIFLPRRWPWLNLIPALFIPLTLSVVYSALIARDFFDAQGGFDSLAQVQQLFTHPGVALAGWVHYLAFDLFVGGIIAKQSDEVGLSRMIQAPILLLTLMFGPFGYLIFVVSKTAKYRFERKGRDDKQKPLNLWWQGALFISVLLCLNWLLYSLDPRMLADEARWLKPIKFEISLIIHFVTLAVLAALLSPERRNGRLWKGLSYLVVGAGISEVLYIFLQAARGRESHFNDSTPIESVMYGLMGVGAVILVSGSLYLGYLLYREYQYSRSSPRLLASALGLSLGSILTLIIAGHMSSQANYVTDFAAQEALRMPLLGWYLNGQDLRIPHFLATHMMQLLPLYGVWLAQQRLDVVAYERRLFWVTGVYGVVVMGLFGLHFYSLQ